MEFVGPEELQRILPMTAAVDALETAFAGGDLGVAPQRVHAEVAGGTLLLMPASGPAGVGVKLVTLNPSNPARGLPFIQGVYVLFAADTLMPECVVDGGALTAIRTAAVSGVATRLLAREDSRSLVIFGAGVQARTHLDAMVAVRPVERAVVVSRSPEPAEELAARARDLGLEATTGNPADVAGADLICTCTTSNEPLFDGELLRPGCHINAVGAYQAHARELDDRTVARAKVVVETRKAALEEAGDLLIPLEAGTITASQIVAELAEVAAGHPVRESDDDITVFKSVGVAFEDLVLVREIADRRRS